MEQAKVKDMVSCGSYLGSEVLTYPISSIITRIQAVYVNQLVVQRSFSTYYGGTSVLCSVPGFLLRIKLGSVFDPYLRSEYNLSQFASYVIVSSTADLFNVLLRCPSEHYRQQFQTGGYTSFRQFYRDYLGYMGPFSFWRGASVFFLRDCIFNLTRFWILSESKEYYSRNTRINLDRVFGEKSVRASKERMMEEYRLHTWCNIVATIPAAIMTTPFDVVKTRIMTNLPQNNQSPMQIFREIIKEEGVLTLFRGAGLRAFYISSLLSIFTSLEFYLSIPFKEADRINKVIQFKEDLFD